MTPPLESHYLSGKVTSRNTDDPVAKPLSLLDLPSDVLGDIFSRLSCEMSLLGAVAKVNREFRKIALHPNTRKCVEENFVRVHTGSCSECNEISNKDSISSGDLASVVSPGLFPCVRCVSILTDGKFTCDPNYFGRTVLYYATDFGHIDIVRYLVEERGGTDAIHMKNQEGVSVLDCAIEGGHLNIVRYFVEERKVTNRYKIQEFWDATVLNKADDEGNFFVFRYYY
eukprot:Rmarinus@m.24657